MRITRKSNIITTFVVLILSLLAMIILSFLILAEREINVITVICGAMAIVSGHIVARSFTGIITPYQDEFVIEMDRLRFGRTDQPHKQRTILRADIECLILDAGPDPSLCVHTRNQIAPNLAPGIVQTGLQMSEVARTTQEHWPEIPTYSREQFQTLCRRNPKDSW